MGHVKISTIKFKDNKAEVDYTIIQEVTLPNCLVCNLRMSCFRKDSFHICLIFTNFVDYMKQHDFVHICLIFHKLRRLHETKCLNVTEKTACFHMPLE